MRIAKDPISVRFARLGARRFPTVKRRIKEPSKRRGAAQAEMRTKRPTAMRAHAKMVRIVLSMLKGLSLMPKEGLIKAL